MQTRPEKRATPSRPKDRSLEAYKAWITEIANRLTTDKTKLNLTEKDWVDSWKDFWKQQPHN